MKGMGPPPELRPVEARGDHREELGCASPACHPGGLTKSKTLHSPRGIIAAHTQKRNDAIGLHLLSRAWLRCRGRINIAVAARVANSSKTSPWWLFCSRSARPFDGLLDLLAQLLRR